MDKFLEKYKVIKIIENFISCIFIKEIERVI